MKKIKTLKNKLPVVKDFYNKVNFSESTYYRTDGPWTAAALYQFAEEKSYPVFDLPLAAVHLHDLPFDVSNLDMFIFQMLRVMNADLSKPILLDDSGQIADGNHRVVKAIIEGKTTIKAIRLGHMPTPVKLDTNETK